MHQESIENADETYEFMERKRKNLLSWSMRRFLKEITYDSGCVSRGALILVNVSFDETHRLLWSQGVEIFNQLIDLRAPVCVCAMYLDAMSSSIVRAIS